MILKLPYSQIYLDTDTIARIEILTPDQDPPNDLDPDTIGNTLPHQDPPESIAVIYKSAPWVLAFAPIIDPTTGEQSIAQDELGNPTGPAWTPLYSHDSPHQLTEQQPEMFSGADMEVILAWAECEAGKTVDLILGREKSKGMSTRAREELRELLEGAGDDAADDQPTASIAPTVTTSTAAARRKRGGKP